MHIFDFRDQLISKGDTIYASLEPQRYLTLQGQQYVPGDRGRVLLPLVFCRECGQDYSCVRLKSGQFIPRELNDQGGDEILYNCSARPYYKRYHQIPHGM